MSKNIQDFSKEIGKKIKIYREKRGLTLRELGSKVGCTGSYIAMLEKGKNNPSFNILVQLSNALSVPILTLIEDGLEKYDYEINDPILQNENFEPYLNIAKEAFIKEIPTKDMKNAIKILNSKS